MQLVRNLLLLSGLVGLALTAPQTARAQSDAYCSTNPATLIVKPAMILDCLRAGQAVNLDGVTVDGDLDLTSLNVDSQPGMVIPVRLAITNSHFTGSFLSFHGDFETVLNFREQVDLRGSQFDGSVDFTGATFEEFAHFEDIWFEVGANFNQATFQNGTSFRGTVFKDTASFIFTKTLGGMDFSEAQFSTQANFSRLHSTHDPSLPADVFFSRARFTGGVFFMGAVFENPVYFNEATFARISQDDAVRFTQATFTLLNLKDAHFENGQLDLKGLRYEKFEMPNFDPTILAVQNGVEDLPTLMANFRKLGNPEIANELAYWQNIIQRQNQPLPRQILEIIFLDWTFGYGLKPIHAVRTSMILILFFAIFYYPEGTLRPATFAPSKPRDRKFTIRLSELPIAESEDASEASEKVQRSLLHIPQIRQVWQPVLFSFGVFTKLGFGSYVAVRHGVLVFAEWIIGLLMIAGFLFSLANTNALVRSVLDFLK